MSLSKFFRLLADPNRTLRWHLGTPVAEDGTQVDPRIFTQGKRIASPPAMNLSVRRMGQEVGFNFCDFDMVVTPASTNADLEALVGTAVQRIPVSIGAASKQYEILNVCDLVPCFDHSASLFSKWNESDGISDRVDQLRMVVDLKIDPAIAKGHKIFRLSEWPVALVVSQEIKDLFERKNTSGLRFERVA